MKPVLKLNENCFGRIVDSLVTEEIPDIVSQNKFQGVIVQGDSFEAEANLTDLDTLKGRIQPARLIEARFFNAKEEYRILRTSVNGQIKFLLRHIEDMENEEGCTYNNSVDTSADFYKSKDANTLIIRNYIKKRGLINSYDDMRFVELKNR